jgi:vanillate O-demethylase monooxygenase subunit
MNSTSESFPLKLYASWHPVSYSHEIKSDKPFGTILLDKPVVIWRTSDGTPYAMRDLCIHRGTAL